MNYTEAKIASKNNIGKRIKHDKGGVYTIKGSCKVQIFGVWHDALIYGVDDITYVRTFDDCVKINLIKE